MNIKIDIATSTVLIDNVIDTIQFGNLSGEDTDLLHIVAPNKQMDCLTVDNNHTLFYKDVGINTDHLFVTPRGFINGLITGSNTLFYELLCEGKLEGTCLDFLCGYESKFITYKLLKSFIGCSERDFKQIKSHKEPEKKLKWSFKYCNMVLDWMGMVELIDVLCLDRDTIKHVRQTLNTKYQEGIIPFSVNKEFYNLLHLHLMSMKTLDLPELDSVSLYYYNEWREN